MISGSFSGNAVMLELSLNWRDLYKIIEGE
jgi:hypothetical protein